MTLNCPKRLLQSISKGKYSRNSNHRAVRVDRRFVFSSHFCIVFFYMIKNKNKNKRFTGKHLLLIATHQVSGISYNVAIHYNIPLSLTNLLQAKPFKKVKFSSTPTKIKSI